MCRLKLVCQFSDEFDVLHVQEQEMAFQYLSELKNHAVETNDPERASLSERLGRQFVRILLDRQDKEIALSVQHKGLQEDSLCMLEEIHKGVQKMAAERSQLADESEEKRHIAELEEEVSRHIALEQEASIFYSDLGTWYLMHANVHS